ncbi:Lipoprotein PlpD [Bordetella tumbae]|uniref:OmpA family protein n=1 Tax=Bordetella tumbae TaxID=1649139 RepID=UPI0039EFA8D5
MKTVITRCLQRSAPLTAALLLAGCGTLSNVSGDGKTDSPVFPDPQSVSLSTGTFPNVDSLALVQDGVTRDQIYELLGRPHFSEGFQVREWDYLFHFRTPEGIRTCQFKILFDSDKVARSFYWAPQDCRPVPSAAPKKYTLNGDVSFAFGSAVITAAGNSRIAEIAGELRNRQTIDQLEIAGHTDRIGSDASNEDLSQRRADAVRQTLIANGIPAGSMRAVGYGERQPIVQCDQQNRSELVACLAPNRRVEINASGVR